MVSWIQGLRTFSIIKSKLHGCFEIIVQYNFQSYLCVISWIYYDYNM